MRNAYFKGYLALLGAMFLLFFQGTALQGQTPAGFFSWDNATVYFLLNDRFNNGNPGNDTNYGRVADPVGGFLGGDLAGITQKINEGYFDSLGVNAIWFTAPYEQIHGAVPGYWCGSYPCSNPVQRHYGYHGYYALDFTEMDANMGTTADLQAFVDAAHSRGIRVIMDIVLNHVGYETTADAAEFGFGPLGDPWQSPNTGLNASDPGWCNWWTDASGNAWIRKGAAGEYCSPAQGGDDLTLALAGLPDIRTDLTTDVGLPNILLTKWDASKEAQENSELNAFFSATGLQRTPANYIIKWLCDWVREYGIDGFRIDTYKHVEREIWGRLKDQAQDAFDDWKTANPSKKLDNNPFWMVGEWYGHGPNRNTEAATTGKTDALINFQFKGGAGTPANLNATYSSYSSIVTTNPDWTFLSYISSHDDGMFDRNDLKDAATSLLLAPGNAQIYYGDETQRMPGTSGSDQDTRSFMNWGSINTDVLYHWKRLGQFRKKHPSIGAGTHTQLGASPYYFKREYTGTGFQDLVVCAVGASGATTLNLSAVFADGTELRDFYTGAVTTVSGGMATFTAHANGVILIEETNPVARPTVSISPADNTYHPTSITVTISAADLNDPNPVIYYTTNPSLPANDLSGWTLYSGPFNLTSTATLRAIAQNSMSAQSAVVSADFYVGSIPGFKVYFKKPSNWGSNIKVHYWNLVPAAAQTTWPGVSMTSCGSWWEFDLEGVISANLIFNDGAGHQTVDLSRDKVGYYDGTTSTWYDAPPLGFDCACPADADNDGVCAAEDCNDQDPALPAAPGTACDDGNASTTNDRIQSDGCSCSGCETDADMDGICASSDCDDNDPSLPASPGSACDDGNPATFNDVIQSDGCGCAGFVGFTVYCKKPSNWSSPVKIHYWSKQPGNSSTTWPGVAMTQCTVNPDWWFYTFNGTTSTNLLFHDGAGKQTADLTRNSEGWYDGGWSGSPPSGFACNSCYADSDNDGVCAGTDCDDNNPNVPALPGTACNDGNAATSDDQIQSDGCTCTGCPADADNDGVCSTSDCDDNNPNVPALPGTACDDGNAATSNDAIQADGCTCTGSPGFTVYVKKPSNWGANPVKIHYWNKQPGNGSTTWPGVNMTQCSVNPDWWFFTFSATTSTSLLFHNGAGIQTEDLSRNTEGWYDGGWLSSPPSGFACDACYADADLDGVCAGADCDDNNPGLPAVPGTSCNDGNPATANDRIQPDGCTCAGCAIDADNDGVCSTTDCDDNNPNLPAQAGTACNDGNVATLNDVIQSDGCTCAGSPGFTVYFKKPSGWGSSIKIYYWNRQPGGTSTTWPGENMTLCANGWYYFTFYSTSSTDLIFNDGTNQTGNLSRSADGWYNNGVWSSTGACTPPNVTVSPPIPTPDEQVTITFDATGSALAGLPKVYFHSGVSATLGASSNFDYSKGNWGQDDGVGAMTNVGGNLWQIVLPSLRAYYAVSSTADVFGLNFLFRSADGAAKEDNSGANYFNPVNTGNYFTITNPASSPHLALIGAPFNLTSTANTAPQNWTLEEVDANNIVISQVAAQTGGASFTHAITLSNTSLRRFKISAGFPGETKVKFFEAQGYGPICTTSRPAWTRPGINYHAGDPTKATLVLHAPTYTRFKKGTGVQSGTNGTTTKNVVHVIGDFNNWTISESYKLCRDTDGWNGTTDSDGDDDRGDYWWIELSGLTPGQEYVFQYLIDGNLQVADPYAEKISDPDDGYIASTTYPGLIAYPSAYTDGHRASVLQTNQGVFNWTAPAFSPPSTNNLNIYELHFRDFTEEGTYLAAIDKLDYLKALGINAIHVMPVSEFEGNSSWGYNPNFYFAPDKAYGTKNDLKKFINECHKRQIQVFNDLVLNHAFYSNVMARLYWNTAQNKPANDNPWFNPDHKAVADPAGWWGVDWNHESEHTQNMVDSVLNFWLQEYHFDGFRFDFTKGFTQTAQDAGDPWASSYDQDRIDLLKRMVNEMWANNPGSVAIFEHLAENAEDKVLADHGILLWSGVGHHNAVKNFMLGWNGDNPDIYTSGIYNAPSRNFNFANWMSYMESHDEERQAVEVLSYGKNISGETDAEIKLSKAVDRLKLGASFNLLFPGPRMLWQFEELAYDVSIDYNGRTGEKPVHWEYFDDPTRRELFRQMSTLLYLRNNYPLYATIPNYGNIGAGANEITTPRRMALNDGNGHYVIVIGNLDPDAGHNAYPSYNVSGAWYRYNGDPAVDGTSFTVSNTDSAYYLQPSEVLVLTNFPVNNPVLDATMVNVSARTLLSGPYDAATGLMRDDLRSLGYLPTTEPYTALGYSYTGGAGGETINPSVLTVTGEDAIVDWVALELRTEAAPGTVVKSRPALLQRDGDIVGLDGISTTIAFSGVTPGDYFITVKHRNHLGIASATAVYLSPVACAMDFARGASATFGSSAQRDLGGGKMGFWPGDANGNGQVQNTDIEDVWKVQVGLSGYLKGDFNLNGQAQNTDLENYWKISVGKGVQLPQN